jgi:hypothetical protein
MRADPSVPIDVSRPEPNRYFDNFLIPNMPQFGVLLVAIGDHQWLTVSLPVHRIGNPLKSSRNQF